MKAKKHIMHSESLTLINRSISSNRWVSPLTAHDNGLKFATISVFTQVNVVPRSTMNTNCETEN